MSKVPADGFYVIQNYEHNNIWGIRTGPAHPETLDWVVGYTSGIQNPDHPPTTVWKLTHEGPGLTLKNVHTGLYLGTGDSYRGKVVAKGITQPNYWAVDVGPHPGTFQLRGFTAKPGTAALELTEGGVNDVPIVLSTSTRSGNQLFRFCVVSPPAEEAKPE